MFDISFTELMLVGVVALIVIGPERLPKVAKTVGHLLGRAQRYVSDVKGDIQREVELDELRKMKDDMESAARSVQSSMQETQTSLLQGIENPINDFKGDLDDLKGDFEREMAPDKPVGSSLDESLPALDDQSIQAPDPIKETTQTIAAAPLAPEQPAKTETPEAKP